VFNETTIVPFDNLVERSTLPYIRTIFGFSREGTLKGKIFSYLEIRKLLVGACVLDPQIQHQMRLENFTG